MTTPTPSSTYILGRQQIATAKSILADIAASKPRPRAEILSLTTSLTSTSKILGLAAVQADNDLATAERRLQKLQDRLAKVGEGMIQLGEDQEKHYRHYRSLREKIKAGSIKSGTKDWYSSDFAGIKFSHFLLVHEFCLMRVVFKEIRQRLHKLDTRLKKLENHQERTKGLEREVEVAKEVRDRCVGEYEDFEAKTEDWRGRLDGLVEGRGYKADWNWLGGVPVGTAVVHYPDVAK